MVLCAEGLLGLGPGPGSLVARWCSGLARVENNDPANDGLWTPETRKRPIDGSSNLPRATITITFSKCLSRRPTSPPFRASGSAKSLFLTQRSHRKLGQRQCHELPRNPSRQPTLKHSLASNTSIVGQPCEPIQ